jgi:hypothetical protein
MGLQSIKASKFVRSWFVVLAAGLVAGMLGVWEDGWHTVFPGIVVWFVLLCCVLLVLRKENRAH